MGGLFEIRNLGANTVLILFEDVVDVNCILMRGPWFFDKYLIGLYKPGEVATVDNATFDSSSFWIQVHGLQLWRMSKENAHAIGRKLGVVECVEEAETGDCRGQ